MGSQRGSVGPFFGRTINVVDDLNLDEQWYLYRKSAELKKAILEGKDLSNHRIDDPSLAVYLIFLEDSTRTKESFRNAALFHQVTVNVFDAANSSVNKKESLSDTLKMLVGYNRRSIFIIRSTLEGVCRHLEEYIGRYADKIGIARPSFINAGDGKHEHPTQEFLDEFSFLEKKDWNREEIHIALTGDLFHGRTVHSKAEGLRIFQNVRVDLVAPSELGMPEFYERRMRENGFTIRKFASIDEYLDQDDVAQIWYFTRLQLERMGDEILEKAVKLRHAVTIRRDHLDKLPLGTKFYHPLPQNRTAPSIPDFISEMDLNGWDEQSRNGYFTRITEIGMLGGKIGFDFKGKLSVAEQKDPSFIEEAEILERTKHTEYKTGIKPVDDGIVIDHIGIGRDISSIWKLLDKVRRNLQLNFFSSQGVFQSGKSEVIKGLISIPNVYNLDETKIRMLAALSPGCTLNIIQDKKVLRKLRLNMPSRVAGFPEISCRNENCISHPHQCEPAAPVFLRSGEKGFVCRYCERPHSYDDIWTS